MDKKMPIKQPDLPGLKKEGVKAAVLEPVDDQLVKFHLHITPKRGDEGILYNWRNKPRTWRASAALRFVRDHLGLSAILVRLERQKNER